jgi:hypothetical protein
VKIELTDIDINIVHNVRIQSKIAKYYENPRSELDAGESNSR